MAEKFGENWIIPEDKIYTDDDFSGIENNPVSNAITKGKSKRRKNSFSIKEGLGEEINSKSNNDNKFDKTLPDIEDSNSLSNNEELSDLSSVNILQSPIKPLASSVINNNNHLVTPNIDVENNSNNYPNQNQENTQETFIRDNQNESTLGYIFEDSSLSASSNITDSSEIDTEDKNFITDELEKYNLDLVEKSSFTNNSESESNISNIFDDNFLERETNNSFAQSTISSPTLSKMSNWTVEKKLKDFDRLMPLVEQILRIAGSDVDIQKLAHDLVLTNDKTIEKEQKEKIVELIKLKSGTTSFKYNDYNDSLPVFDIVYDEILGLSVLGDLWRDDDITEIMVDRWDKIVVEKNGNLVETGIKFKNPDHAASIARSLALRISDRALSTSIPLVTAELPNARITFAFGSVVKGGLSITLRKFKKLLTLEQLIEKRSLSNEMVDFLKDSVISRAGILVSGGTGTGKTTIINLLSTFIPENERVITIEDAFELNIHAKNVVSLQTKEASSRDDQISITMADLLRNTLRMRPDRIIVGEIREGEGASVMLAAANTGHDGTMTTIHASGANLALNERLVDLVRDVRNSPDLSIKRTIVSAFELVVQVTRGRKGQRYISDIALVDSSLIKDGEISPYSIFVGEEQKDGTIIHKRVAKLPKDSSLGLKHSLINVSKWSSQ